MVRESDREALGETDVFDAGILECSECHQACMGALAHSLMAVEARAARQKLFLLLDCAQACQMTADFLLRNSPLSGWLAGLTARICDRSAEWCADQRDDELLESCAEICRRAADACRMVAQEAAFIDYDKVVEDSFPASDPPPGPIS